MRQPAIDPETSDERRDLAVLAYGIGSKYRDCDLDDRAAASAQWKDLAAAGFTAMGLPEEQGGVGGLSELCLVMERVSAGGLPPASLVLATIVGSILGAHGSDAQRQTWLPRLASGDLRFCFALTEPAAGSNAMKMRTSARLQGDTWVLRGQKTYISGVDVADAMVVVSQDVTHGGLAAFIVELPAPAVSTTPLHTEVRTAERQFTVYFDDVRIPESNRIGEAGRGANVLFAGLNPERLVVAATSLGLGRFCLEKATSYAKERAVFDVPIGAHQAIAHPLAECLIGLEAGNLLLARAARLYDAGRPAGLASNMAKVAACDAGFRAADRALQTFGGSGYTTETKLLQRYNFLRLQQSIPVSREMALNHIATAGLTLPKSY